MNKEQIKEKNDMELVFLIQDIGRFGNENKYTKEFEQLVRDEICRRGEQFEQLGRDEICRRGEQFKQLQE